MKMKYVILLLFGLLLSFGVSAQTVKHLSLSEAVATGVDNSKQLKIALSKVRGAEASTQEMKDKRLPDLGISGQYMRLSSPSVSINKDLLGEDDGSGSGGGNAQPVPKYITLGQASLSMPLFAGFKIKNGIQSAHYLEKAANLDAESQQNEVMLNIIEAYINLYKAQEAVNSVEENLKQAKQRVKDFSNLETNGLLAKNDLLKAQLMESNTSLALLDAKNNARVANYNMNLLLGLDENTTLAVDSLGAVDLPQITNITEWHDSAMQGRKDLQAVDQREKAGETAIKIAKSGYLPSIALTGGYIMADIDNIVTVKNAMNFGVGINFNLASLYKGGSQIHQAQEQHVQTQLMREQLTDKVKSQVFKSYSDYQESVQRIAVYETATAQAAENYRIVKNKHRNNLVTTTELLDADVEQFQAELNLKYARVDAIAAYCKLLLVSGQLDSTAVNHLIAQ